MKRDPRWIKSRASRILLRQQNRCISRRDVQLAQKFAVNSDVTDRLIDQALASICAAKKLNYKETLQSVLRLKEGQNTITRARMERVPK